VTGIVSGNSFTSDSTANGNGWAHLVASSAGTYNAQWTNTSSGTYASSTVSFKAASTTTGPLNACDLNADGAVNVTDAQLATDMALGITPCTANIYGANVCNIVVVQRVINAALTGNCVTGTTTSVSHSVTLTWTASTSSNVSGYNIYRSTTSGTGYSKINTSLITALTYTDNNVQAGQTYYYVATAVDSSNAESAYSTQASATVPTP
jgi:hypothetical protein